MSATQDNNASKITTPLGKDKLLLRSFTYREQLGRLFQLEAELFSEDEKITFDQIVGKEVSISLRIANGKTRYFHGIVSAFTQILPLGRFARYHTTIVPWLWLLTRTADCRIFQQKTVPDIIKKIFKEYGFTDIQNKLKANYQPWVYCVQYRETDFNFVSRLIEQEGIYYFWRHDEKTKKHYLVLADDPTAHDPFPDYKKIKFRPEHDGYSGGEDISNWSARKEIQPGLYALTDYNYEKPKASLQAKNSVSRQHSHSNFEVYDYPGEYDHQNEGKDYSKMRLQELQAHHEVFHGISDARGIAAGSTFHLEEFPRKDQNRPYLITAAYYSVGTEQFESASNGTLSCSCNFEAIDVHQHFRPARITPKPIIQGPQTAVVVGPKGQEIYVDKHARIKVQFHWDREGKKDENSSCWIRVSQPWAGKGYGGLNIPRIGQEVIVEFLEGDPDQPIINGRVYNFDQVPQGSQAGQPELERIQQKRDEVASKTSQVIAPPMRVGGGGGGSPASGAIPILTAIFTAVAAAASAPFLARMGKAFSKKTANPSQGVVDASMMTTLKSNSLGGSGGSNEITLSDAPGSESLFIKAEKDLIVSVNHDYTTAVEHDMVLDVTGNRHSMINGKDILNVSQDSENTVGKRYSLTVKKAAIIKVAKREQHSIGGNHELTVGGDALTNIKKDTKTNVTGNQSLEVAKDSSFRVGGNHTVEIKGDEKLTVEKNHTVEIKGEQKLTVEKTETVEVKDKITVTGKKNIEVEASDKIVLKCGPSSITLTKDGIEINGAKIEITASANCEIKGAMVMINS